jgi:hypothetical protein
LRLVYTRESCLFAESGIASIASLLLGYPAYASGFQSTKLFENVRYESAFFQDDIRVSSRLKVISEETCLYQGGSLLEAGNMFESEEPATKSSLATLAVVVVIVLVILLGATWLYTRT